MFHYLASVFVSVHNNSCISPVRREDHYALVAPEAGDRTSQLFLDVLLGWFGIAKGIADLQPQLLGVVTFQVSAGLPLLLR